VEKLHMLAISSGFTVKFPSIFYLISDRKYSDVMLCTPRKLPRDLRRKSFVFGCLNLELRELSCSETSGTTCPAKRQIQEVHSHQQIDHKKFKSVISNSHMKHLPLKEFYGNVNNYLCKVTESKATSIMWST
jgi:hypothetical protein